MLLHLFRSNLIFYIFILFEYIFFLSFWDLESSFSKYLLPLEFFENNFDIIFLLLCAFKNISKKYRSISNGMIQICQNPTPWPKHEYVIDVLNSLLFTGNTQIHTKMSYKTYDDKGDTVNGLTCT